MGKFITPNCQQCPHRKGPLMGCCQLEELEFIAGSKVSQSYQKGQRIFQEGAPSLGLHCVSQGKIKVTKTGGDGKEQIVRLAKDGDMLGFQSLLTETKYSTSAVALEDCVVCFIPRADFFRVWQSNVQFSTSLMQMMAKALGAAEVQMLHLAYKPVRERLAEALLLLYHTFRKEEDAEAFSISFSREDLASLVGTAKETATRLLSDFKEAGIIATRGSLVSILQPNRLSEIASLYD
ncbi:Crp/Fnr family transcriptional regulator [Hymenobacter properus]|uniref:Crp/Fnr family transcriptional regulator n=1 Tax=Hymenobacter properus TaxID=2791026 RepID=A0A931FML0_9BACT|nr:Crp/Fnr family transcriptional regulator [Hymenobacter properus]MBF9141779.1 Crp/Fnr family transcriptional regulator [Hymenobacter properus]MBR7720587.1 Crp/Fnr family transcriptional regulator [Microvirga sp. SRT04]